MSILTAPTQERIVDLLQRRYKDCSIEVDGPLIRLRKGLNKGANIRLRPEGIECLPRTFLDDNSKAIISAAGTLCGMLVVAVIFLFLTKSDEEAAASGSAHMRSSRGSGSMLAGGFAGGAFAGGCIAGIAMVLLSPKSTIDANRIFARDMNAWLDRETK